MRLWLKDSERRPDPAPVKTDDRKAIMVGLVLWLAGLALVLTLGSIFGLNRDIMLWTCAAGIGVGLMGLIYTNSRHS